LDVAENLITYLQAAVPEIRGEASTLASEMKSVKAYLGLMKVRMGPRLTTHVTVDPTIEFVPLAPLLIHTLVENAIKHGIEPKVGPVLLSVSAGRDPMNSSRVCIEVSDNGMGLMIGSPSTGTGHGLNNISERLRLTYGDEASLQTGNRPGGGFLARITIPMPKEEMN
jgi:sensor histidine kinase YesM